MILPQPGQAYDARNETEARDAISKADAQNIKKGGVIDSMTFRSPSGAKFALSVSDIGALVVTAL